MRVMPQLPTPRPSVRALHHDPVGELDCPPELDGLEVLVVDDEADVRDVVQSLLESCRARVRRTPPARPS